MPKYRYQAVDAAGKLSRGVIAAMDDSDVEERLHLNQLTLISASVMKDRRIAGLVSGAKIKPRILIELYHRLSQTLALGLPMLSALEENQKILPSRSFQNIIEEICLAIEGGNTLYEAMSRFPSAFEKLDLAIIHLGEISGTLPERMKELANFIEWKEDIRSTVKRAAIYPSFIIVVIIAVVGVWTGYVLPQMAGLLHDMGVALPGVTQMVLDTSDFLRQYWGAMGGAMALGFALVYLFYKTGRGGILIHRYILKMPLVGKVFYQIPLARLSHNFATMYGAGMNVNQIFGILKDNILGNRYLEARLGVAFEEIQRGALIAEGFANAGGFPPLLLGAIRSGEATGTIDASFKRLGDYYDGEIKRSVQAMISAIEPLSIVLLGGVFGLIALSIMLPLYDVVAKF
ncbi:MAG: type II secretion system F family protein [Pseudomonadota bacterium]